MKKKKIVGAFLAYLISAVIYLAFFSYPVDPAGASTNHYVLEKEEKIYDLPYAKYRLYLRKSETPAILIVATVRSPFIPSKTYSRIMRNVEEIMEKEVKERYKVEIDVVFIKELQTHIGEHQITMQEYEIHLKYLNYFPVESTRPDTLRMDLGAYFCHEKYESVIVAYAYPPIFSGDFEDVMASISC